MGQSIKLHCIRSVGGGCGHMLLGTMAVLPSVTSCMQKTSRVWSPMPQLCEQGWNSLMFHRGGHGWSLHVCVNTSGWSLREHKYGDTIFLSSSRIQSTRDSCTPEDDNKKKKKYCFRPHPTVCAQVRVVYCLYAKPYGYSFTIRSLKFSLLKRISYAWIPFFFFFTDQTHR